MPSRREQVVAAVTDLVRQALPAATVERNASVPARIPAGGHVIVRDGDPGEPEVTLSPATWVYEHRVPIEAAAAGEGALDALLVAVGTAIAADRTLGGLCDWVEAEAPTIDIITATGAVAARAADFAIVAVYGTASPLG